MDEIQINRIDTITGQIIACKNQMGRSILEIGKLLIEAKEAIPHGDWLPWLRDRVEFSERTAQNFMRVAREYASNPQLVADLGSVKKAIALLDVPEEERETFVEETGAAQLTARQLEEAIRARQQAEADLAEKERQLSVANGTLTGLNEQLTSTRRELEELKARPVEVAVETVVDEDAVKKAVKKAVKEAKEKAEKKAEKELSAQRDKVALLEKELTAAKASSDTQRAEEAETEVARLRKELAIARNEDVYGCQICFEQIKDAANRMQGHIRRLEIKGQTEEHRKCRMALGQLAQALMALAEGATTCD